MDNVPEIEVKVVKIGEYITGTAMTIRDPIIYNDNYMYIIDLTYFDLPGNILHLKVKIK